MQHARAQLRPGDLLQSLEDGAGEGTSSRVASVVLFKPVGQTFNLTVDIGHTFYVGKLKTWVHNTGPCKLPGATVSLPNSRNAREFEAHLSNIADPGERVAVVKIAVQSMVEAYGMVKERKLTRINNRDVYRGSDGLLYAVDTQHGRFEVVNPKNGRHLREVDFDFNQQKPADKSGGHDLKVK
ncbi:hypothetical protein [Pseudomonas xanthosomatis]|uniref:hypothetical protein n=1 Tax=Pseudomonas xanthosomatis TaxID=2842356 RepID=UPI0035197A3E